MVKILIQDIQKTSFSKSCLRELASEGVKEGDIIEVSEILPEDPGIDFISKKGTPCVAWKGITCKILND